MMSNDWNTAADHRTSAFLTKLVETWLKALYYTLVIMVASVYVRCFTES